MELPGWTVWLTLAVLIGIVLMMVVYPRIRTRPPLSPQWTCNLDLYDTLTSLWLRGRVREGLTQTHARLSEAISGTDGKHLHPTDSRGGGKSVLNVNA